MLPSSTLYPSIGFDFLDGLKSCLEFYQVPDCRFAVYSIGYGLKDEEIRLQAEKLFLQDQADMVVAFADHRVVSLLDKLASSAGKLLVVTNGGANYPEKGYVPGHVIQHSLNNNLYAHLTGILCGASIPDGEDKSVIACTSYYDGGYRHTHAMESGLESTGGYITYRYVGHFKKEAFTIAPLDEHLQSKSGPHRLLCSYSGDVARFFFEQLMPLQKKYALELYGSPMMFDKTPGDYSSDQPWPQNLRGYTGWFPELDNEKNREFKNYFLQAKAKEPNLFSLQGWEVALLLASAWQKLQEKKTVTAVVKEIRSETFNSPRGELRLQPDNMVTGPAYLVSIAEDGSLVIEDTVEHTDESYGKMLTGIPDTPSSSWLNTYLCI